MTAGRTASGKIKKGYRLTTGGRVVKAKAGAKRAKGRAKKRTKGRAKKRRRPSSGATIGWIVALPGIPPL